MDKTVLLICGYVREILSELSHKMLIFSETNHMHHSFALIYILNFLKFVLESAGKLSHQVHAIPHIKLSLLKFKSIKTQFT